MFRSLSILLISLTVVPSVGAQGFNNSSFERPDIDVLPYLEIGPSSNVQGFNTASTWNVISGTVDVHRTGLLGYWLAPAAHGNQVLDLTGSSGQRGVIEQTINTGSLTSLDFAFSYSRNVDYNYISGNSLFSAEVRIYVGTTNYLNTTVTIDANGDGRSSINFNWQTFQQTVSVPANTDITLRFTDTTTANGAVNQGILLDFIRPVPEPASIAAISAVGLWAVHRLRRKPVT